MRRSSLSLSLLFSFIHSSFHHMASSLLFLLFYHFVVFIPESLPITVIERCWWSRNEMDTCGIRYSVKQRSNLCRLRLSWWYTAHDCMLTVCVSVATGAAATIKWTPIGGGGLITIICAVHLIVIDWVSPYASRQYSSISVYRWWIHSVIIIIRRRRRAVSVPAQIPVQAYLCCAVNRSCVFYLTERYILLSWNR